ncbi:MAG TPA: hypothetical protein VF335_09205, partial [Chitinivibrionales bacterium]
RFHLFTTSLFNFAFLSEGIKELRGLYYEVDGALIADAGNLWHHFSAPTDRRQNGAGIGVGLNIKAPSLRLTGSIDVVWPVAKQTDPAFAYYNRTVIYNPPTLHVFLSAF